MIRSTPTSLFLAMALGGPTAAFAGLEVCNDTGVLQAVAIGYQRGDDSVSEGWWTIEPDTCQTPLARDLAGGPIYLHAKSPDPLPARTGAEFCTSDSRFTIVNSNDCIAMGHQIALFHAIPIEEGETHVSVQLSRLSESEAEAELIRNDAVFQSCQPTEDGEALTCAFHAGGIRYEVGEDTPASVLSFLGDLAPTAPLAVRGHIVAEDDLIATVRLSSAQTRPETPSDNMLLLLQGEWVSSDDPNERLTIVGSERTGHYEGADTGTDYLSIQDSCSEEAGAGPYLQATDSAHGDVYCYAIESLEKTDLSLFYLPRGNLLEYHRPE
ncbi:DUF1036 domain-containing protein [Sedimentitalea todarodis]|uniref:DUF1036 domain-containing protein n=1 Tax=Sedimentitalea todarodis TaxID=1631240 RepID=A0ABU3VJF7_9RHOB|nr:DUF1036 domain-containing protein [Sedimentitalea todarodis]MDU9006319.1 DUF1036 domain-containing protein [Sedimentitalea todarodis]